MRRPFCSGFRPLRKWTSGHPNCGAVGMVSWMEDYMCYNCGCGMPNNDMGKPANITNKKFEEAAKAMGQDVKTAKANARALLEKVLAAKTESQDKNWKP